jgi:hypothetical protein
MSVQAAMDFIHNVKQGHLDQEEPVVDPLSGDLQVAVEVGREMGFDFTHDELRAAFRHHWQRRWLQVQAAGLR